MVATRKSLPTARSASPAVEAPSGEISERQQKLLKELQIDAHDAILSGARQQAQQQDEGNKKVYHYRGAVYEVTGTEPPDWLKEERRRQSMPSAGHVTTSTGSRKRKRADEDSDMGVAPSSSSRSAQRDKRASAPSLNTFPALAASIADNTAVSTSTTTTNAAAEMRLRSAAASQREQEQEQVNNSNKSKGKAPVRPQQQAAVAGPSQPPVSQRLQKRKERHPHQSAQDGDENNERPRRTPAITTPIKEIMAEIAKSKQEARQRGYKTSMLTAKEIKDGHNLHLAKELMGMARLNDRMKDLVVRYNRVTAYLLRLKAEFEEGEAAGEQEEQAVGAAEQNPLVVSSDDHDEDSEDSENDDDYEKEDSDEEEHNDDHDDDSGQNSSSQPSDNVEFQIDEHEQEEDVLNDLLFPKVSPKTTKFRVKTTEKPAKTTEKSTEPAKEMTHMLPPKPAFTPSPHKVSVNGHGNITLNGSASLPSKTSLTPSVNGRVKDSTGAGRRRDSGTPVNRPTPKNITLDKQGKQQRWSMSAEDLAAMKYDFSEETAQEAIFRGRLEGESKQARRRRVQRELNLVRSWPRKDDEGPAS
jgi:hypothetical protein